LITLKQPITTYRPLLASFIGSALTPFIGTLFLIRITSLFILFPIYIIALIVLIISTFKLARRSAVKKSWIITIAAGTLVVFFFTYSMQLQLADAIYFKIREKQIRSLAFDIKRYGKIVEMTNGLRYWKSINNTFIERDIKDVETISNGFGEQKYLLDDVLNSKGIDKKIYEQLRQRLIETGFISFIVLNDGSISFTMDGMLDNCYGISYSETGGHPKFNDCGEIIRWVKISDNWYAWGTT
jgi:hypothetical protein